MRFEAGANVVWACWLGRIALAAAFFSAVADRVGRWGAPGQVGVVWGDFSSFVAFVDTLAPWTPASMLWALALLVTVAEVVLGALLLLGWRLKEVALASGYLLAVFAVSMVAFTGLKSALDYSVPSACAAAFLLAAVANRDASH